MVLEIIGAAVLLAFGIVTVYFSIEGSKSDKNLFLTLLLGIAAIIAGGWIILTKITLALILTKLAGLILLGIGIFLVFGFPDIGDYQRGGMSNAGIFIGLVLVIIGGWLLFF